MRYTYDGKRRVTAVDLDGTNNYVTYAYSADGRTTTATYTGRTGPDGTTVADTFETVTNARGNTVSVSCNGTAQITAEYDDKGRLAKQTDGVTGKVRKNEYDTLDRITEIKDDATQAVLESYTYNDDGNVATKTVSAGGVNVTYTYGYKPNAAKDVESVTVDGVTVKPQTDCLGRNRGKEIKVNGVTVASETVAYRKVGDHATNMLSAERYGEVRKGRYVQYDNRKYKYDASGNMTEVWENGVLCARYEYDALNRLIREDNRQQERTWIYVYDNNGNILNKRMYFFTLCATAELKETGKNYMYGYEGDRLFTYDDELCAYDEIGNPKVYRGKLCTWEKGRQLVRYNNNTFAYDGQGRRISKNSIEFTYDSNGNLIKQSNGLSFIYDDEGVVGVKHNNTTYFYRRNAMGDIIALLDNSGAVVVKYVYDAWGNHVVLDSSGSALTSETHIGNLNPFRYRGYYFDTETGWYFLKTRYYDPEVGRFITIDDLSYLDPDTINGLNLYAYCGNNPVMNVDPNGSKFWKKFKKFLKKAAGVVAGVALLVVAIAGVALSGGSLLVPVLASAAIGATASLVGQGVSNLISGKGFFDDISLSLIGMGALAGAAFATGLGGFWGTVAIGATANLGTAAIENKSWAEIAFSGFVGGIAGGLGYSARTLISGKMFNSMGNSYFKDFMDLTRLDTNTFTSLLVALRAGWTTFLPSVANGLANTITKGIGKLFGKMKRAFRR